MTPIKATDFPQETRSIGACALTSDRPCRNRTTRGGSLPKPADKGRLSTAAISRQRICPASPSYRTSWDFLPRCLVLVFDTMLALLFGATILSVVARRANVPYPTLMALGGALLAFLPGAPQLDLRPDLMLALFVAPVLLDAAYRTSLRDLRQNWRPISSLVLVAVGVTTIAVALAA